jgi:hypothetical protein
LDEIGVGDVKELKESFRTARGGIEKEKNCHS